MPSQTPGEVWLASWIAHACGAASKAASAAMGRGFRKCAERLECAGGAVWYAKPCSCEILLEVSGRGWEAACGCSRGVGVSVMMCGAAHKVAGADG